MPLQGLLQGRSGLALGVIIPLLSFYFIQLRPKRSQQQHRLNSTAAAEELPPPAAPAVVVVTTNANSNSEDSSNNISTPKEHMSLVTTTTTATEAAASSETLKKKPLLHDHHLLPPQHSEEASSSSTTTIVQEATISERALWILRSCSSEWTAVPENAYDEMHNPTGCIQLAVPINKVCQKTFSQPHPSSLEFLIIIIFIFLFCFRIHHHCCHHLLLHLLQDSFTITIIIIIFFFEESKCHTMYLSRSLISLYCNQQFPATDNCNPNVIASESSFRVQGFVTLRSWGSFVSHTFCGFLSISFV